MIRYLAKYHLEVTGTAGFDRFGGRVPDFLSVACRCRPYFVIRWAGPSVLGISSGASLGVAFVVLLSGAFGGVALSKLGYMGEVALSLAAVIGACR